MSSTFMEEKWTTEQTTCLARELMFRCLKQHTSSSGNLYSGGLGASYLLYDYSQHVRRQQNGNAAPSIYRSKRPLQQACEGAEQAVSHPSYQRAKKRQASMFESEWVGAHCLYAITLFHLGKKRQAKENILKVLQRISGTCCGGGSGGGGGGGGDEATTSIKNDVATGRAGALQAIWWLRDELQVATIGSTLVVKLAKSILQDGGRTHSENRLLWCQPGRTEHFHVGAAKGQVGILYTLLGLSPKEWDLVEQDIPNARATIAQTIAVLLQDEKTTCMYSQEDCSVDWSHGATGLVLLLIRASQVFANVDYLKQAHTIAETVLWPRGATQISKGVGLAFGSSGIAITFLLLSKYCLKPLSTLWQRRAEYYAQWAMNHWDAYLEMERELPTGWNIYSLYEGLGGLVTLLLNLHQSESIHMPLYSMGYVYPSKTLLAEEDVVLDAIPQQPLSKEEEEEEEDPTTNEQGTAVPENSTVPESTTPVPVVVVEAQPPEEEKPPQTKPVPPEEETPPKQEKQLLPEPSGKENDHHQDEKPEQSPTTSRTEPPSVIRRYSEPPHFVVPTNESIFWSLQTESLIGTSLSYKPAMVATSPMKDPHVTPIRASSSIGNTTESGSQEVPFYQTPESTRSKSFTCGETTAIPPILEEPKAKATNMNGNSRAVPNASHSVKTRPGLYRSPPKSTATRVSATRTYLPPSRSPAGGVVRSAAAKSPKISANAEKCAVRRAEEEVRSKQAREARRKAQEEARLRVEKQARLRAEKVARAQAETEARQKATKDTRLKREAKERLKAQREGHG